MCSIPFTVVVNARSLTVTIRPSISVGDSPLNCQMTVTTGMLIEGKMSTDIVVTDSTPSTAINKANTTNVYGRRRASRTIHILTSSESSAALPDRWRVRQVPLQETISTTPAAAIERDPLVSEPLVRAAVGSSYRPPIDAPALPKHCVIRTRSCPIIEHVSVLHRLETGFSNLKLLYQKRSSKSL